MTEHIHTITGPLDSVDAGIVLPHEHIFVDLRAKYRPPPVHLRDELRGPVLAPHLELLRQDYRWSRDNLVLDNWSVARDELMRFRSAGGRTICDLSSRGIRIDALLPSLLRLSEATDVNIVVGTGSYTQPFHDKLTRQSSEADLARLFAAEITDGIGDTGVRAGVIGELGLSRHTDVHEFRVLAAAAGAQELTGAPIVVHQRDTAHFSLPHRALDMLEDNGVRPERVAFAHVGDCGPLERIKALLDRGALVSFDFFGIIGIGNTGGRGSCDTGQIDRIVELCIQGYTSQLMLSHDICNKVHLRHWGGHGYDYLLRWVVPELRRRGLEQQTLQHLLSETPSRWLTFGR